MTDVQIVLTLLERELENRPFECEQVIDKLEPAGEKDLADNIEFAKGQAFEVRLTLDLIKSLLETRK